MIKILLACNAGMSTSLLAEMMNQSAKKEGLDCKIWCIDREKVDSQIKECDVLLLGPQIRQSYKRLWTKYGETMPVAMISSTDYGRLDGEHVLQYALSLYKTFYEQKKKIEFQDWREERKEDPCRK
ncbi:PTS sugar transporter subunit IIB [Faecalitalea cylindroides]|uniref:PTS sugar transporter subunit IIB n=1 Tax=Faecalitalea cylindroides TaxID=39483 RepID=UPI00195281CD|nr:PTS sugar transporter subunit IIB [Faecalitalea cylindroides]